MEDGEYRRCSAPNCTLAAATNAHLCKRCQTRCDRGLLPNYKPFARGRPKKKISSLCPRRQKQVLKKLANDIISEVSERSLTPKHKEIITCLLGDAEVINLYSTSHSVPKRKNDREHQFGIQNHGSQSSKDSSHPDSFDGTLCGTDSLRLADCIDSYY